MTGRFGPTAALNRDRKGAVLLAVMLVITIAALVGTSVLYVADAQRGSTSRSVEQAQLRSLAWSGVQGVMAQLGPQRESLLRGDKPTLTAEWTLFEGSLAGEVRLAALDGEAETSTSEAAKLDLNMATPAMLAKLPGLNEEFAGKIVAARRKGLGSAEEVVRVQVPASVLLDVPAESAGESVASPGLLALTTVFAFDPNLAPDGEPRINLSAGWSDDIKTQVAARFGDHAATIERLFAKGGKLDRDAALVQVLRRNKVEPGQWNDLLALVTTSDEQYLRGRVDLNLAPVEVLAAIPGIDRPAAEKIIDARPRLSSTDREKVTWPLTQGLLTQDQFEQAYVWLATRSLQWRVRVEARLISKQAEKTLGSTLTADSELLDPPGIVWEAVIDVSETRPRVAYLRDVTHLPALARHALAQEQATETRVAASSPESSADSSSDAISDVGTEVNSGRGSGGLKSNADLKLGSMKRQDLKLESGLELGSGNSGPGKGGTRSEDGASPSEGTESAGSGAVGGSGGTPPPAPKDRRIGRWRGTK